MDDLIKQLSNGKHPVIASRVISARDLSESIDRGYVIIKFTDTQGGTELGMRLDTNNIIIADANVSEGKGIVHLAGFLTLNNVKVRCVVDIDCSKLRGFGFLEILDEEV